MDTICSPFTEWALKYISTATYLQREKEKDYLTASSGTSWGEVSCAQSQKGLERHWNSLELSQCVMPALANYGLKTKSGPLPTSVNYMSEGALHYNGRGSCQRL